MRSRWSCQVDASGGGEKAAACWKILQGYPAMPDITYPHHCSPTIASSLRPRSCASAPPHGPAMAGQAPRAFLSFTPPPPVSSRLPPFLPLFLVHGRPVERVSHPREGLCRNSRRPKSRLHHQPRISPPQTSKQLWSYSGAWDLPPLRL
jgi:hypothetical protein